MVAPSGETRKPTTVSVPRLTWRTSTAAAPDHQQVRLLPLAVPRHRAAAPPARLLVRRAARSRGQEGERTVGHPVELLRLVLADVDRARLAAGQVQDGQRRLAALLAQEGQVAAVGREARGLDRLLAEGELQWLAAAAVDQEQLLVDLPPALRVAGGRLGRGVEVRGAHNVGDARAVGRDGQVAHAAQLRDVVGQRARAGAQAGRRHHGRGGPRRAGPARHRGSDRRGDRRLPDVARARGTDGDDGDQGVKEERGRAPGARGGDHGRRIHEATWSRAGR